MKTGGYNSKSRWAASWTAASTGLYLPGNGVALGEARSRPRCGIDIAQASSMKDLLYALLVAAFASASVAAQNPPDSRESGTWI